MPSEAGQSPRLTALGIRRRSEIQVDDDSQDSKQSAHGSSSRGWSDEDPVTVPCGAAPPQTSLGGPAVASPRPAGRLVISVPITPLDQDNQHDSAPAPRHPTPTQPTTAAGAADWVAPLLSGATLEVQEASNGRVADPTQPRHHHHHNHHHQVDGMPWGALKPAQADKVTPCIGCDCSLARAASPPPSACIGCTCGLAERAEAVKVHRAKTAGNAATASSPVQPPASSTPAPDANSSSSSSSDPDARSPDEENYFSVVASAATATTKTVFGLSATSSPAGSTANADTGAGADTDTEANPTAGVDAAGAAAPGGAPKHEHGACDACDACDDVCNNLACKPCDVTSDMLLRRSCKKGKATFTMCQIARHNTTDSCWIVANKTVYDCTAFIAAGKHPGGNTAILKKAGKDCSADFKFHSKGGRRLWSKLVIGKIVKCPRERCKKKAAKPWNPSAW